MSPFSSIPFSIICFPIIFFVQDTVSIHLITTHPYVNYITVMDKIVNGYVSILVEINSTNNQNFTEKDSIRVPQAIKTETNIIKLQEHN